MNKFSEIKKYHDYSIKKGTNVTTLAPIRERIDTNNNFQQ